MRGEYKVPGGKLVAVELQVQSGHLQHVAVSGDFFLEPDEALEAINGALEGAPEQATMGQLAERVRGALPKDTVMLGFGPESVAMAVRRALGKASAWSDHAFQLFPALPLAPVVQMALDEVIAKQVSEGRRPPTLRFWDWASNAVVIGCFQSLRNEVDPEGAARHAVTVVRRVSGGGAMFIEPGNTITYSLYVPGSLVDGLSFQASYAFLDDWVLGALRELGIEAAYAGLNDIASAAGKIAGAAQKRMPGGGVLHHVTMAYDIDAQKMLEVLRIGREKLSDKGTKSAAKRVDPLRSQTGLPRQEVIAAMTAHFRGRYGLSEVEADAATMAEAEALAQDKYSDPAWIARVP